MSANHDHNYDMTCCNPPRMSIMSIIKDALKEIREERLCSEHNASRTYYRGYRDALLMIKDELEQNP